MTLAFSLLNNKNKKELGTPELPSHVRIFVLSLYIEPTNETNAPQRSLIPNAQAARKMLGLSPPLSKPSSVSKQPLVAKQQRCVNKRCTFDKVVMFWLENRLEDMVEIREQKCRMQAIILKGGESAKFGISIASSNSSSGPIQLEAFRFVQQEDKKTDDDDDKKNKRKLFMNGVSTLSVKLADSFDQMEHIVIDAVKTNDDIGANSEAEPVVKPESDSFKPKPRKGGENPADTESGVAGKSELIIDNTAQHHAVKIIDLSGNMDPITIPSAKKQAVAILTAKGKSLKLEATSEGEKEKILLNGQEKLDVVLNSKQTEFKIKVTVPLGRDNDGGNNTTTSISEGSTKIPQYKSPMNSEGGGGGVSNDSQSLSKTEGGRNQESGIQPGAHSTEAEASIGGMVAQPSLQLGESSGSSTKGGDRTEGVKVKCDRDSAGRNIIMLAMNNTLDHPIAVVETINNLEPIIIPPHTTCKVGFAIQGTEFLILTGVLMGEGKNKSILLNGQDNLSVQIKTNPDEFRDIKVTGNDVDYNVDHISVPIDNESLKNASSFKTGDKISNESKSDDNDLGPSKDETVSSDVKPPTPLKPTNLIITTTTTSKPTTEENTSAVTTTTTSKPTTEKEETSAVTTSTTSKPKIGKDENSVTTTPSTPATDNEENSAVTTTTSKPTVEKDVNSVTTTTTSKPTTDKEENSAVTTTTSKPTVEKDVNSVTTTTTSKPTTDKEGNSAVTTTTTSKPTVEKDLNSVTATTTSKPTTDKEGNSAVTTTATPKPTVEKDVNSVTTTTTSKPTTDKEGNSAVTTTTTSKPTVEKDVNSVTTTTTSKPTTDKEGISLTTTTTPKPTTDKEGNSAVTTTSTPKPTVEKIENSTATTTALKPEMASTASILVTEKNENSSKSPIENSVPTITPKPTTEKVENSAISITTTQEPSPEKDQKPKTDEDKNEDSKITATVATPKPTTATVVATTTNDKGSQQHKPTTNTTTKVTIKKNNNTITNFTKIECHQQGNNQMVNKIECLQNNNNDSIGNNNNNTNKENGTLSTKAKVDGIESDGSQGDMGDVVSEISEQGRSLA